MDESGHLCERARFWASLRLDGELSELEGALLDAHLASCVSCREVAGGFGASTTALRAAALRPVPAVTIEVPRSGRRLLSIAAVAAVLLLGAVTGGLVRGEASKSAPAPRTVAVVATFETADQIRRLRRTTLLNARTLPRDLAAEPV